MRDTPKCWTGNEDRKTLTIEAGLDLGCSVLVTPGCPAVWLSKTELTKQIAAGTHLGIVIGKGAQGNESINHFERLPTAAKTIWRIITRIIDFLDRLWYNIVLENYFF